MGSIISGLCGKFITKRGVTFITVFFMILTFLLSLFAFFEVMYCQTICTIELASWIESNLLTIKWGFLFDNLTVTMLFVINSISLLVHIYSINYMGSDPHLCRFMSYLSLFTFFMLMLVTANNFIQIFLGWEGVGLASYLLINFWYTRIQANKAAMKAIVINRIGDLGLSIGIGLIFLTFKSLNFSLIFAIAPLFVTENFFIGGVEINKITLISLFLFVGAVGKSAQIGLHTWLPDAMEGPTPVSALIHAATMVTAGVFVLLRCSPLLEYSEITLMFISFMGGLTAFMAATIGVVQNDLKKVIAYSTCSQLGYMIFAAGLSNYSVSLFHLMNHAFFKALLFLSAGSVIHALADEQDMRKMGGLLKLIPITYVMILIGSLSLMGFPFLTGFYSKDALLELTYGVFKTHGLFSYWLGTISAFFTSFYSIRLLYLTFLNRPNNSLSIIKTIHESSWYLIVPLLILSVGSIFIGYFFKELFLGVNVTTWNQALFYIPENYVNFEAEFLPFYIKLIPVIFSLSGGISAFILYLLFKTSFNSLLSWNYLQFIYHFLNKKWYIDNIYNKIIVKNILDFSYHISFKKIDRGLIEIVGPLGLVRFLQALILKIKTFQTGLIYNYAFLMLLGIICILFISFNFTYYSINLLIIYLYLFIYLYTRIQKNWFLTETFTKILKY